MAHRGLRTWCCCTLDLIPGTSICLGCSGKREKIKKKDELLHMELLYKADKEGLL